MAKCPECGGSPEQPRVIEVEGDRMTRPGGETCSNSIHTSSAAQGHGEDCPVCENRRELKRLAEGMEPYKPSAARSSTA